MTKNINGDIYSDLITSADPRAMAAGYFKRKKIDRIVIHHNATTNKNVALNTWLANGAAQTSAHYEVADKELIGAVGENVAAWHAGNGDMNARSIGIEHKNSTGAPSWLISEDSYHTSARLIADIAHRYGFYPDATHVIPHKHVVATACPGGIDMNKLIKLAQQYYSGNKPKPAQPKPASGSTYTVARGDTLYAIGRKFGVSVDALKAANGLRSNTLKIGQKLNVSKNASRTYTVTKGDTLYGIGRKFGKSVSAIKSANGLKSNTLQIGQKLKV